MINLNLRRENPQDNVNRILAIESLIKYYPIEVVKEVEPRVIHSWVETDEEGKDFEVVQINVLYVMFGLPTPELRHLMEKLAKKVLKDQIPPKEEVEDTNNGMKVEAISEAPTPPAMTEEEQKSLAAQDRARVTRQAIMHGIRATD